MSASEVCVWLSRWMLVAAAVVIGACQSAPKSDMALSLQEINEAHVRAFGDYDLPRRIGAIENIGLQLPTISPDGRQVLYLRSDVAELSPMTLLASPDARDTPAEGTLSIWLRSTAGAGGGRRVSSERWAHSPIWSPSGNALIYVANTPPTSAIVHLDLSTQTKTVLGVPGWINCLARFDGHDQTVLFCAAKAADAPFRIYRQSIGRGAPTAVTTEGVSCMLALMSAGPDAVVAAQAIGEAWSWVVADGASQQELIRSHRIGQRGDIPTMLAGIDAPVSPGGRSFMYYESLSNQVCVYDLARKTLRRHRPGSIAACWLTDDAIALANDQATFVVSTSTGLSLQVLNGPWIPRRYVPGSRRLILLGRDTPQYLSIVVVDFKDHAGRGGEPMRK